MLVNNQFEKPLKLTKIALLFTGIKLYRNQWHRTLEVLVNHAIYYINIVILYAVIFGEIYWFVDGIQIGRDYVGISLTAPCITISILSTLKSAPVYYKRDIVSEIIYTLGKIHPKRTESLNNRGRYHRRQDFQGVNEAHFISVNGNDRNSNKDLAHTDEDNVEENIENKAVNMINVVGSLLSVINVAVLVTFLLVPLMSMYWGYFKTGKMEIQYPFLVKYWFDAYKVKFWPLIYLLQVWATIIVCVSLIGTETLFYTVCIYIEMHFRILSHRFENVLSRPHQRLVEDVRKHQLLIQLVEKTEALFSVPVLLHIVSSSLLICLSAFNITVAEDLGSVVAFVTFLGLSFSQISLLCLFGDKLMRSSTEVSDGIYKCPWYDFDVNTKKALLIILMRAQKPCRLTACNFADLNLRAFTTILSRSWSYFALLKTVYK